MAGSTSGPIMAGVEEDALATRRLA